MSERRVLIIDDEDDIREVAQVSLEVVGGWEVVTAGSGREGLSAAQESKPDAILLDVMMPDMDGPTTFGKLQENPATRGIPVIFLTAKVHPADHRALSGFGAAAVIAKPFDPLKLSEQVSESLGWPP